MNSSTHIKCIECPNPDLCDARGTCAGIVAQDRRRKRKIMDTLSVGDRFALMFGRGKFNPLTSEVNADFRQPETKEKTDAND